MQENQLYSVPGCVGLMRQLPITEVMGLKARATIIDEKRGSVLKSADARTSGVNQNGYRLLASAKMVTTHSNIVPVCTCSKQIWLEPTWLRPVALLA